MSIQRLIVIAVLAGALGAAPGQGGSTTLADFENQTAGNMLGGYFFFFDDRGDSGLSLITSADSVMYQWNSDTFAPGAGGSQSALKLGFVFGAKDPKCGPGCSYAPQVGMGTHLMAGGPVDLTGAKAVSFWAKAAAPLRVTFSLGTSDITDNGNFMTLVSIGTEWKQYRISLGSDRELAQPSWSKEAAFDLAKATSFGWGISKGDNAGVSEGVFFMDDVVIEGWTWVDPTALAEPQRGDIRWPGGILVDALGRAAPRFSPGPSARPASRSGSIIQFQRPSSRKP